MKLSCSILINNRLMPSTSNKFIKSTLSIYKTSNLQYCILLLSSENKNGSKYDLKSIKRLLTRLISNGKIIMQFETPPHDLYIQADQLLLKNFVQYMKRAYENNLTKKEIALTRMLPTVHANPSQTVLFIRNSSGYSLKELPQTLLELHLNHMMQDTLNKEILNLTNLQSLDISHNSIVSLPIELNSELPNLRELHISHNKLGESSVDDWAWLGGKLFQILKLLDMGHNGLTFLPPQIIRLQGLVALIINHNQIKLLPSGIGNLQNLTLFSASNNLISILPGSMKKLRLSDLDLTNNSFDENQINNFDDTDPGYPKPLPVRSLKEYAACKILSSQLFYSPETLPQSLSDYLDNAQYCVCGKACFTVYTQKLYMLSLVSIAKRFCVSSDEFISLPIDCHFCCIICLRTTYHDKRSTPLRWETID